MDHKPMDHKPMDHKPMDHKPMDHKPMDHKIAGNNRMLIHTKLVGNWGAPKFGNPASS